MPRNLSNEQFSVDLEESPGCIVSALVKVSPEVLNKLNKQALKKIKKEVALPGFRKGKAPDDIIASRYPAPLRKELGELLTQDAYHALSTVGDRRPLSPKAVRSASVIQLDLQEGGKVEFNYEAFPVIPDIPWGNLSLPEEEPVAEVSDDDLKKGLENIAMFFATKTPVERPSQEGDFLSISLHVSKDNEPASSAAIFENKYFKLSEEEMSDAFKEKFLGIPPGHQVVESIGSPEIQSFLRGNTLTFTVNSVIEVSIPEIDEKKAQQLQAESLDDLKAKLRLQLEKQAKDKQWHKRFSAAEDALATLLDFELPTTLFEERVTVIKREKLLNARLIQYCSDEELEAQKSELIKEASEDAKKALKLLFLTHKIFADAKLTISREELQYMIDVCSKERFGAQPPKDISNDTLQELVMSARDRLTYSKAIEHVLRKAEQLTTTPSA
ncbi:Trigger factor,trigger factor,FKBP-type peptidyl-prolyl cis-trans isomerase (trigger factor),trigger factor,Bacterial trigger factor protein (TF) [Chlamydia serpentis]|uniref:Trigger factor n=1 Tax=Chlamydia serpentis TaxID=1967782 RepID=A0A2R8FC16_9CHLA|nr:trigger factor [Chlamydia serpentis]SPN73960.1 Trigger factor,trigger factor,FKBP-type peptidyl-prolyl cis-trans isomerase (trigger factor),trigger factor,Bacterial trigger factor protein (TF) [Chlamydia serpentis]